MLNCIPESTYLSNDLVNENYLWKDGLHMTKSLSKLNTECITELKKLGINNVKNVIIANSNVNSLVSKIYELKVIEQAIFAF